jgi:hypothetical protein
MGTNAWDTCLIPPHETCLSNESYSPCIRMLKKRDGALTANFGYSGIDGDGMSEDWNNRKSE